TAQWGTQIAPAGKHQGAVNVVIYDAEGLILSAGADGFLGIWNPQSNMAEERFQLSPYSITAMALRPGAAQIALIESDGLGLYRVSAWDYHLKKNLFSLRFREPITALVYSGAGNFLLVSRGGLGMMFLLSETGEALPSFQGPTGSISFAATGKSERTMIAYSPVGILSYWELDSGAELRRLSVPPGLTSPILFGNNRFLGGMSAEGLQILDAVSGNILIRDSRILGGILLPGNEEGTDFYCFTRGDAVFSHYQISADGRLEIKERKSLPRNLAALNALAIQNGSTALGTVEGTILSWAPNAAAPKLLQSGSLLRIKEAAVSGSILAFITEQASIGFIPLDFTALRNNSGISLETIEGYTSVSADFEEAQTSVSLGTFLFWRADTTAAPQLRSVNEHFISQASPQTLSGVTPRFPIRSASILDGKALFLDSVGNITVIALDSGQREFTYSSVGSLDTVFLDPRHIVIGRSAVSDSTPFLVVNIETGETVPLAYSAAIGARVYRGAGGTLYGAVIDGSAGTARTGILRINMANPRASFKLTEWQGEDSSFGIAESYGVLASTLGGEGAVLYSDQGVIPFERCPGLPLRLISGGSFFIIVDAEGNMSWYDSQSAELQALLCLGEREWILKKRDGESIRGALNLVAASKRR
ncbi:MAG: WD40 repeat domain-containing protein, partial [Treponema sp.]|nr:WD40 repeat domain-containing protein [Treponema sp.]